MTEHKVGTVFKHDSVDVKVMKSTKLWNGCNNCYFRNYVCWSEKHQTIVGDCYKETRTDGNEVYFAEVR